MHVEAYSKTITTDAGGDATDYIGPVTGRILAIHYAKDDFAAGVDFAITAKDTGDGLWTEADVNAAKSVYPRAQVHDLVGAVRTLDGTRAMAEPVAVANQQVKVVIAQGGNAKSGTFTVIVG